MSRLVVWAGGLLALAVWGAHDPHATGFDPYGLTRPFGEVGDALVGPAARWDSMWFLQIADAGYVGDPNRAAFFPLYPGLIALLAPLLGGVISGLVISWVAFAAALIVFHRLAEQELGPGAARWATWALALFPGAHWFSAVYSESLFLLLSVGSVYAARNRRWLPAALLGALAAATRSAGLLLALPIALLWWDARRIEPERVRGTGLLAAPAVGLGLLAVCIAFSEMGLGFSAPFDAQETWNRSFQGPLAGLWDGTTAAWDGVRQLIHGQPPPLYFEHAAGDPLAIARHNLLLWITLLLALVLLVHAWRHLRPAFAAYATLALLLPLSYPVAPQPLMSMPRFVAVLFPLFMSGGVILARIDRRSSILVLSLSAAGLGAVSALFTAWRWVA